METQSQEFTEMAFMRYQRTWRGFEAILNHGESATLSAYCKSVHVNYEGMKKWVSASGLSVRRLKQGKRTAPCPPEADASVDALGMFVQFMPPAPGLSTPMHGVSVSFPEGISLTLQECTPEGIVTLLETYVRRRSAREAECSR